MKIAYLLGSLNRGGTETLMVDTLQQAVRKNIPCLLIHRKKGSLQCDFERTGAPISHLPIRHRLDVGYLFRLRKLLQTEHVQIVHGQLSLDAFLAYWACLGTGIKIVLTFHGFDIGYDKIGRWMIRFMLHRADLLLYVSDYLRCHYLIKFGITRLKEKHQILYNGIDFRKLQEVEPANIRQVLKLPTNDILIGMVGNFVEVRDQLTVCKFLQQFNANNIDYQMLFIGAKSQKSPEQYDACISFCEEHNLTGRIHFIGSRADIPAILSELDAFVYASDHDTFGIAVVEAMGARVPVFVNDWAVMCEITNNGEYVTLYQTKNEMDLMFKFTDFIENPTPYKRKAIAAQYFVEKQYAIENYFQLLNMHYKDLYSA